MSSKPNYLTPTGSSSSKEPVRPTPTRSRSLLAPSHTPRPESPTKPPTRPPSRSSTNTVPVTPKKPTRRSTIGQGSGIPIFKGASSPFKSFKPTASTAAITSTFAAAQPRSGSPDSLLSDSGLLGALSRSRISRPPSIIGKDDLDRNKNTFDTSQDSIMDSEAPHVPSTHASPAQKPNKFDPPVGATHNDDVFAASSPSGSPRPFGPKLVADDHQVPHVSDPDAEASSRNTEHNGMDKDNVKVETEGKNAGGGPQEGTAAKGDAVAAEQQKLEDKEDDAQEEEHKETVISGGASENLEQEKKEDANLHSSEGSKDNEDKPEKGTGPGDVAEPNEPVNEIVAAEHKNQHADTDAQGLASTETDPSRVELPKSPPVAPETPLNPLDNLGSQHPHATETETIQPVAPPTPATPAAPTNTSDAQDVPRLVIGDAEESKGQDSTKPASNQGGRKPLTPIPESPFKPQDSDGQPASEADKKGQGKAGEAEVSAPSADGSQSEEQPVNVSAPSRSTSPEVYDQDTATGSQNSPQITNLDALSPSDIVGKPIELAHPKTTSSKGVNAGLNAQDPPETPEVAVEPQNTKGDGITIVGSEVPAPAETKTTRAVSESSASDVGPPPIGMASEGIVPSNDASEHADPTSKDEETPTNPIDSTTSGVSKEAGSDVVLDSGSRNINTANTLGAKEQERNRPGAPALEDGLILQTGGPHISSNDDGSRKDLVTAPPLSEAAKRKPQNDLERIDSRLGRPPTASFSATKQPPNGAENDTSKNDLPSPTPNLKLDAKPDAGGIPKAPTFPPDLTSMGNKIPGPNSQLAQLNKPDVDVGRINAVWNTWFGIYALLCPSALLVEPSAHRYDLDDRLLPDIVFYDYPSADSGSSSEPVNKWQMVYYGSPGIDDVSTTPKGGPDVPTASIKPPSEEKWGAVRDLVQYICDNQNQKPLWAVFAIGCWVRFYIFVGGKMTVPACFTLHPAAPGISIPLSLPRQPDPEPSSQTYLSLNIGDEKHKPMFLIGVTMIFSVYSPSLIPNPIPEIPEPIKKILDAIIKALPSSP